MASNKRHSEPVHDSDNENHHHQGEASGKFGLSRRQLLGSTAAGAAVGVLGALGLDKAHAAKPPVPPGQAKKAILLKGGVVLTMDPDGQDYVKANVRIEGSKIVAIGPNVGGDGAVIDCTGKIVMPGIINTHHHQYETVQRSAISDGLLRASPSAWPQEDYFTVVQNIWTNGLIPGVWDLGRSPYDPDDCYISELVASWANINSGMTTTIDTSQCSHTPEHTDAMISRPDGFRGSIRLRLFLRSGRSARVRISRVHWKYNERHRKDSNQVLQFVRPIGDPWGPIYGS